ncbi:uncharacterized protein LOC119072682 [Bradysia coprophila]|uniref:uncharacterized protein LOC119072682 n=1 Tax=Bradysia coprophila TaxID=38358 RepID=UPI00187DA893|nr:uncharacterized protein LOC119072682 [Bradysia coprophila]
MDLEKFCFCCKLQKGVFIWGILSIVFCFIVLIANVTSDVFVKRVSAANASYLYWAIVASSIIYLIASVLLCIGVFKEKHYIVLPYVIVNGIYLIPIGFIALIGLLAAIPIFGPIYVWWCICTYYLKIRDERTLHFQLVMFEAN